MLVRLRTPERTDKLADGYFSDDLIGRFVRLNLLTWEDIARHSLNEISEFHHEARRRLDYIKDEILARGMSLKPFNVFDLISRGTRKLLAAGGISQIEDLCSRSESELRKIPRFGDTRVRECEETLGIAGLIIQPMPEPQLLEPLRDVEVRVSEGKSFKEISEELGVHVTTVASRYRKLQSARSAEKWKEQQMERWRGQFARED